MDKFRLSLRRKSHSEPELDFRPTNRRSNTAHETATLEQLAQAERSRWTHGGGGAVVSEVEWVPDPLTGGQRAVFRPTSTKILQQALKEDTATEEDTLKVESPRAVAEVRSSGADSASTSQTRAIRAGRKPDSPVAEMTDEEKAAHAKQVIEAAIEAERQALERKLAIKKKG